MTKGDIKKVEKYGKRVIIESADANDSAYYDVVRIVDYRTTTTATIASGGSLSGAIDLGNNVLCAIIMPSSWNTANITMQASADGTNYFNVYDKDGTEYTIVAAASRYIVVPVTQVAPIRYIKLRSGTSGTAVTQSNSRAITVVMRPV